MRGIKLLALSLILTMGLTTGCEGPAGPKGPEGPEGPVGPAGEDGSMLYSGAGAPDSGIGSNGDYYLNTNTGEMYGPKDENGWGQAIVVLMGQDGQDGEAGSQIFAGTGAPDNSMGVEGDYYLDTSSYELYGPKTSSGWGTPLNLKGADGNANVTLYIYDAPAFTSSSSDYTVIIDDLSYDQMVQSSWDVYLTRGVFMHFIPGMIDEGTPSRQFNVSMLFNTNSEVIEFNITLISGPDYFPDEIRIFRTSASNINDNTSSSINTSNSLSTVAASSRTIINKVGLNNLNVVDKRTDF